MTARDKKSVKLGDNNLYPMTPEECFKLPKIESKQEVLLNFSDEFIRSELMLNPVVAYAIEILRQGEDVYKVLEFTMKTFVEKDKQQLEVMKQLIEQLPIFPGIKTENDNYEVIK